MVSILLDLIVRIKAGELTLAIWKEVCMAVSYPKESLSMRAGLS